MSSRTVTETISGSVAITKLDRLGRNALDVAAAVADLDAGGIKVHYPALGAVDLTGAAGKLTMHAIYAVDELELDRPSNEPGQAFGAPRIGATIPAGRAAPLRRGAAVVSQTPGNRRRRHLACPEINTPDKIETAPINQPRKKQPGKNSVVADCSGLQTVTRRVNPKQIHCSPSKQQAIQQGIAQRPQRTAAFISMTRR